MRAVFEEESREELPGDGDLSRRDALVQPQGWRRCVREERLVERWYWVVEQRQYICKGEEDSHDSDGPEGNVHSVGVHMSL